jgi:S1-C subfamily serine protease
VRFRPLPGGGYEATPFEVALTLEARPLDFDDAPETDLEEWGFRAKPLTQDWRRSRQIPAEVEGVVVARTEHASPADIGGLQPGDLILKVDDRPVPAPDDLARVLGEAKAAKRAKVVVFVRRGTATLFLTVKPDG